MTMLPKKKKPEKRPPKPDLRVQLYNEGEIGPIEEIQVPTEAITQLNAILYDIDPKLMRASRILRRRPIDPDQFYQEALKKWLGRHPVLDRAQVRISGTGLHAILWFEKPVIFENDGDRERWAGIVEVVQAALPVDPDQPGILATTRKLGSINSRNNAKVRRIEKGRRVTQEQVLELFEEMRSAPFKTVMRILTGTESLSPCPICGEDETKLQKS